MIKFDKDVLQALKTLEKAGFKSYATGDCIRAGLAGLSTYDWDIITLAQAADLEKLFPQGTFLSDARDAMRVDYTFEAETEDGETYLDGAILDIHVIGSETGLEDYLRAKPFTVNAIAENPDRGLIDPCGGRDDFRKKLIRTNGSADMIFKKNPIQMMEAVALASELGFDLSKAVFEGILANWRLLLDYNPDPIRECLERLIVSSDAGKGLKTMAECGLMAVVFGEHVSRKMSHTDMKQFNVLCENIHKTHQNRLRRLGLLYTVLNKKSGLEAIERLHYPAEDKQHLVDAMNHIIEINFLNEPKKFKRFLSELGKERYMYLHNLAKAQRIIFDYTTLKVESRNYALQEIKAGNEAVFVEDLVIDANDIMAAGITDDPERAAQLLFSVLAPVHKDPRNNNREFLLKTAKKYSKNKLAEQMRYVSWYK
ncbi:MAG: CCA tRNA nucleotidyltransferase [Firmicutes bacterium]|nr:CCA tRNA nucleotidyltransferase [Bacillota bacterium]